MADNLINVVILGAGGFAREVLDVFDAVNAVQVTYKVLGFIVDHEYGQPGQFINDKPILGDFEWLEGKKDIYAICGIGAPDVRRKMILRLAALNIPFCSVIHPNAILTRWVTIGDGVVITAGCILTNQIKLGNHVHVNLDCTIGHDAIIEDYVTLSPGVHISGNVRLKTGCYIGTGANIIEKVTIGEWSTIGAGSTIVRDVGSNETVVGVPGKSIKTKDEDWYI